MSAAASYPRSTGSARGQARRRELLERVTEDVLTNGLAGFTLRRAARAAGTTHKVLLYHFASAEDLLTEAVAELRRRRVEAGIAAAAAAPGGTLVDRVRVLWPVLLGAEADAMDQAMGLAMYDPQRYGALAATASEEYLDVLRELCPADWDERRKDEVSMLILASLRGLVLTRRTSPDADPAAGLAALERAIARELAASG
jgi:AcrR family transcriptional regulator